ncbi:hypothetical protein BYT27DRAFT_7123725 [Phlegmacium glaucopus]|nr:hypothetical protein BYT27DRAFT_7123725 [Phlegmacium glaucopus]
MSYPTSFSDWMRFIHIIDPSHHDAKGWKINCFTKKYKEWLPHPEWWHVLVLRNVKVVSFQDALTGTGYSNKLTWAAFSPSTNSIYHGQLTGVPREEGLADGGFGVSFSPFYQPKEREVRYCLELSDWWRKVQKIEQSESIKDTVDPVHNALYARRVHRLISEAGPSMPPNGYFDCTVEVLKGFPCFNGVHNLYVTDYTRNDQMRGVQSSWCPTSLSDFVLQMEMWDGAAEVARTMQEGDYYLIKNARMRANPAGYLEGKVAQSKMVQLEEKDAQTNKHLQTLLERKKVWAAKQQSDTEIAHQLIQDVDDSKFFHCTVELVHAAYSTSDIYVTDYTSHPSLGIIATDEPWSKGLDNCLARIRLSDEQRHVAESAVAGSFYSVKKLRLKYSPTEGCFRGFLGGTERLIQVLNPNRTDNEHLNGLLRRREAWQQKAIQLQQAPSALPTGPPLIAPPRQSYIRIKDISSEDTGIQKYSVFARAVDFYPLKLEDAFYQLCKRCNIEIPKSNRACVVCSDFEHQYIQYLYQLYVMIEDDDGKQIMVSINDECPLLEGLERVYMPDNMAALRTFRERLKPLLGNLTMVHSALLSEKKIEIDTTFGVYEVDSWVLKDKRAFCLVKYDQVMTKSY